MNTVVTISAARATGPLVAVVLASGERHLLSTGRLAELALAAGDELDADGVERLRQASADQRTEQRLLRLIATRPRSRAELERRLAQWQVPEPRAQLVLAKLERAGLLDDTRLADALSDSLRRRGHGSLRVAHDLERLGVDHDVAAPALADHAASDAGGALRLLARRFGPPPYDHATTRRAAGLLARRGFDQEAVSQVLDLGIDEP
jgi:regulatory protein